VEIIVIGYNTKKKKLPTFLHRGDPFSMKATIPLFFSNLCKGKAEFHHPNCMTAVCMFI